MPAKMIKLMPLPTPRSVICSPSHMMNVVPVASQTAMNRALIPELRQNQRINARRADVRANTVNGQHRQREQSALAQVRHGKNIADAVDEILDHDFAIPPGAERIARRSQVFGFQTILQERNRKPEIEMALKPRSSHPQGWRCRRRLRSSLSPIS